MPSIPNPKFADWFDRPDDTDNSSLAPLATVLREVVDEIIRNHPTFDARLLCAAERAVTR